MRSLRAFWSLRSRGGCLAGRYRRLVVFLRAVVFRLAAVFLFGAAFFRVAVARFFGGSIALTRPTTFPSGSAKSARLTGPAFVGGSTVRPPDRSTLASEPAMSAHS